MTLKEPDKLKEYTMYQYRLLRREKVSFWLLSIFMLLFIVGLILFIRQFKVTVSSLQITLSVIIPYFLSALITIFYGLAHKIKLQLFISPLTIGLGILIPKSLLTKSSLKKYELSVFFVSYILILGLYVWISFSFWILIVFVQSFILLFRFFIYSRTFSFPQASFVRYEIQGIGLYSTDGT